MMVGVDASILRCALRIISPFGGYNDICRQRRNDTCDGNESQQLQMERLSSVMSIKRVDARLAWRRPGHHGQLKVNATD